MTRNTCFILPVALALSCVASAAHAQSGIITFNGEVTAATCEVSFNDVIGASPQIRLPVVSTSSLTAGSSAGHTQVDVHIEGADPICSSGNVGIRLDPTRTARLRNGRLVNQALTVRGTNALVGLRDANDSPINLDAGWTSPPGSRLGPGSDITFYAEYYAEDDAIAGIFEAPLQYTLTYP